MVNSASNALHAVKKKLYNSYHILITKEWWVDHNRKAVIQTKDGQKFFVLFRREFFLSYGKITGKGGAGESINVDDFEYAAYELDIEQLLYVYESGQVYKIRPQDIKKNSIVYENKADGKTEYLFPINLLQKL